MDVKFDLIWKALADPTRRRVLDLLKERPMTTGELCERFEMSRFGVMKHLGILEAVGLVVVRRRGRQRWNYVNAVPIRQIHERWVSRWAELSAASLVNLKRHVEGRRGGLEPMADVAGGAGISSFQIAQDIIVNAPRQRVWEALTAKIDAWWVYRLAEGEESTLSLEPKVGGQFVERWGDGAGALWGIVMYVNRPKALCLSGPLGITTPVNSVYRYELHAQVGSTLLKLTHHAFGEPGPHWAEAHERGWHELLHVYLKAFVEQGRGWRDMKRGSR
jgi:DNA-binding transcriptional ArsR family regulator/uncharacterized protein YndB with AHSA1/START domain